MRAKIMEMKQENNSWMREDFVVKLVLGIGREREREREST